MNLVGQAVNKNLKNDAHLTFLTSSLPKIKWAMADESDAKKVKTEENFEDKEEFDSLLKEYKRKNKELYVTLVSLRRKKKFSQFYCKLCNVQSTSQVDLNNHRAGKNHRRNLKITNLAEKNSKNFHLDPEVLGHKLINRSRIKKIGRRLLQIKDAAPLLN